MDEQLEHYKRIYLRSQPTTQLTRESWEKVAQHLPEQDKASSSPFRSAVFLSAVFLLLIVGIVGIAQAAQPNGALYPVKLASDALLGKILHKPQLTIEKRANDIIKDSNQSPQELQQAISQYTKTLEQAKQAVNGENPTQKQQFRQSLQQQEEQLKQISPTDTEAKNLIDNTVHSIEQTKHEVLGASSKNQQSNSENNSKGKTNKGNK